MDTEPQEIAPVSSPTPPPLPSTPAAPQPPPGLARSPLSISEILVQLGIVVVGILLALSFEGLLQASRDRTLVREARQNLHNEIRNNQTDIQLVLKSVTIVRARFMRAIDVLSDLSTSEHQKEAKVLFDPANPNSLTNGFTFAWLNSASYSTAQLSGALGLMEYDSVRRFAEIYDPQAIFTRAQDAAHKEAKAATMLGTSLLSNPTPADIADVRRQLRLALGPMIEMEVFAKVLNERYASALKDGE